MLSRLTKEQQDAIGYELRKIVCAHSALYNYREALHLFFEETLRCIEIADNVMDGVVIEEQNHLSLLRMSAFYEAAMTAKAMLGGNEPIIEMGCSYKIEELEIMNGQIVSDVRMTKLAINRISNDLTYSWDFRSYETAAYAAVLLNHNIIYLKEDVA